MVNNIPTVSSLIWQMASTERFLGLSDIEEWGDKTHGTLLAYMPSPPPEPQVLSTHTSALPYFGICALQLRITVNEECFGRMSWMEAD